ncbi:MAG: hypothetical protein CR986_05550 [Ignavibacteriae bacterium]|nr:MAG: hypothetical protein CR986_05550 [Ignavibacteriota bacterium]
MRMNPQNIAKKVFESETNGYSKKEVTKFLEELSQEFENLSVKNSVLKKDVTDLRVKIKEYKKNEKNLSDELTSIKKDEGNTFTKTQDKALKILEEAEKKSQEIINKAEAEAQITRDTLLFLKEQREIMLVRLKVIINNQERILSDFEKETNPEELNKTMLEAAAHKTESEIDIEKIMEKLL